MECELSETFHQNAFQELQTVVNTKLVIELYDDIAK